MKPILAIVFAITASVVSGAAVGNDGNGVDGQKISNDDRAIVHVLNRIGFGPRPGDIDKVRTLGVRRYIDEQLHPERIADAAMGARLAGLTTIGLSAREISERYERPAMAARRERQRKATGDEPGPGGATPRDPRRQQANSVLSDLAEHKLLRAVYSEQQLQEVLTDFWFNHFNVDARKNRERFLLTEYERDVIRPRVLGTFRDLLGATAKSPAMLFYLDNWMSADPNANDARPNARRKPSLSEDDEDPTRPTRPTGPTRPKRGPKGLNENYARELMELHTIGVEGGYTQKDVTEVARAFTGWTIVNPRQAARGETPASHRDGRGASMARRDDREYREYLREEQRSQRGRIARRMQPEIPHGLQSSGYRFDSRMHDNGAKVVLGHAIKAGGGESDGEQVLDILAAHRSTARFIATKLARRFVSDTPPAALVDRVAARFKQTGGDLREMTRTILTSPEFLSPDAHYAKVKTPFEFVVSALRATATDVQDAVPLIRELQQLGMPLYMCQPPTGYKDTADAWVNTGALVSRMNYALKLARDDKELALMLGAPEFQKR